MEKTRHIYIFDSNEFKDHLWCTKNVLGKCMWQERTPIIEVDIPYTWDYEQIDNYVGLLMGK